VNSRFQPTPDVSPRAGNRHAAALPAGAELEVRLHVVSRVGNFQNLKFISQEIGLEIFKLLHGQAV